MSGYDVSPPDDREVVGPLRAVLVEAAEGRGCGMKDLTVLATQNDPFRIDTPAGHRDGAWLAMHAQRLRLTGRRIHLRGLHYMLVTDPPDKPNGETYANTDPDWRWLQDKAADAARWLGYIPFGQIIDRRNAAPVVRPVERLEPQPYLDVGLDIEIPDADDIEPRVGVAHFTGVQPYRLALIGEKSSLEEVLAPVANRYHADLYLPTGEISDTLIHRLASDAHADGRPLVVLYFSDADPAGWQMPVSVARKLQAFKALTFHDLDFQVRRVALTPDQVREFDLPSTPLKPSERRANAWTEATGLEQTEIDALASLRPDLLRRLAEEAIEPFYDATLDARVEDAYDQWVEHAQAAIDAAMDQGHLERLRDQAGARLAEMHDEIAAINAALRMDVDDLTVPPAIVPEARVNGQGNGLPLVASDWPFTEQCRRLIASKAYRDGGMS